MRSPGRPPVGRLERRQRFWAAIARGASSEDAAAETGVSAAVGVRWIREGGGMPSVTLAAPSGRYLSFAEREGIALLRAEGCGMRAAHRPVAVDDPRELRRNAGADLARLDDASMRFSHEAIYQSLYSRSRGALPRELTACLRTGRGAARPARPRPRPRKRAS